MSRPANLFSQSIKATFAFKLRAFFCIISVALGIASIVIIVAAVEGAYKKAFDIVEMFGPDAVMIIGGNDEARAVGGNKDKTITLEDVKAVRESFACAYVVVPVSMVGMATVFHRDRKERTFIIGSDHNYSIAWSWPVVSGANLAEEDVKRMKNVALIGRYLADELFKDKDPVGKYLFAGGLPIRIAGVLKERGTTPRGHNMDNRMIVPISTAMRKMQNEKKYVSMLRVRFIDQSNLEFHVEELRMFLRQRHRLHEGEPDDFMIISPKEIIKFLVALTGSLVLFIGIAGITTLVVAGFVLANLFLLSVKERTREIGIRRAVGARRQDILFQFLGESVILTTAGGLLGFVTGFFSSKLLVFVAQFPICFSWKAFAAGIVMSWAVGIVSGLQPALHAAGINPIEAIK